jgi:DNA repair protein RecN (Recombination protein N)
LLVGSQNQVKEEIAMLSELRIQNFAVIEDLHLEFGPNLTIISGDEGAGKSLIVDAISILLGARAPSSIIRCGAANARVEGIFWLSPDVTIRVKPILKESAIDLDSENMLIICRDIQPQGRSIARVNSHAVPLSLLRHLGQNLIDVHGQMDYMSLLNTNHQLDILDAYGGLTELKAETSLKIDSLRQKTHELNTINELKSNGHDDLLRYQIQEIENAGLNQGEDQCLQEKRDILRNAESIKEICFNAYSTLYGDERSATTLVYEAITSFRGVANNNVLLSSQGEQLESTMTEIEEVAREIKKYGETIDADANQLEDIEHRLNLINTLKHKYGTTIDDIFNFHARIKAELEELENRQEEINRLQNERNNLEQEIGKLAEELSLSRRKASKSLSKMVNEELSDIGLQWANFDISLHRDEDLSGIPVTGGKKYSFTRDGIDTVEFMVTTNPGEPMRPLSKIASGGETCRIMLALKSALKRVDPIPTLIFDEIDGSVGGRSGDSMGRKLAVLGQQHQVLCITHLPQIACFGDSHIKLFKEITEGRASTKVEQVEGRNRIQEIAAMLGAEQAGQPMVDGANKLLVHAKAWKKREEKSIATANLN